MECQDINKSENNDGTLDKCDVVNGNEVLSLINETMCFAPITPVTSQGPPIRGNFPGEGNFEISIDGSYIKKKKFLYSAKLNSIYVDMGVDFPLKFNWDSSKLQGMFVRATVVFSDPGQTQKRVEACYQHSFYSNTIDTASTVIGRNVLRSGRELGVYDVFYCGRHDDPDCWYSVLVAASPALEHPYQFVCKNSCSSGINRRNIEIIFTLEDVLGVVYGRQSVGARVCSVPRRDLNRDELALDRPSLKKPAPQTQHTSKKCKIEDQQQQQPRQQHDTIVTLPKISVVGIPAAISGLQVMLSMQEQALAIKTENHQPVDDLIKCITELRKSVDDLEAKVRE